jgi:hypothetical protein
MPMGVKDLKNYIICTVIYKISLYALLHTSQTIGVSEL